MNALKCSRLEGNRTGAGHSSKPLRQKEQETDQAGLLAPGRGDLTYLYEYNFTLNLVV